MNDAMCMNSIFTNPNGINCIFVVEVTSQEYPSLYSDIGFPNFTVNALYAKVNVKCDRWFSNSKSAALLISVLLCLKCRIDISLPHEQISIFLQNFSRPTTNFLLILARLSKRCSLSFTNSTRSHLTSIDR